MCFKHLSKYYVHLYTSLKYHAKSFIKQRKWGILDYQIPLHVRQNQVNANIYR